MQLIMNAIARNTLRYVKFQPGAGKYAGIFAWPAQVVEPTRLFVIPGGWLSAGMATNTLTLSVCSSSSHLQPSHGSDASCFAHVVIHRLGCFGWLITPPSQFIHLRLSFTSLASATHRPRI
jgi:hypothetical protein